MSLGMRLRNWIDVHGMSVKDFSREAGVPYRSLHEYLSSKRKPSADHMENMANIGIDINWLLTGKMRRSVTFNFTEFHKLIEDQHGIIGADEELSRYFFDNSVKLVDKWIMDHPDDAKMMGFYGIMNSVFAIWAFYARGANEISEFILNKRRKGASVDEIGGHIVAAISPFILENMKILQPNQECEERSP